MIYQFMEYELDPLNFSLKKNGENLEIEPQVFNLILFLIENHNRLVTRDEIYKYLWGDKSVLDSTLSNHIKNARSILGDNGQHQRVIKTVHGRGYQFVSDIKIISEHPVFNKANRFPDISPHKSIWITLVSIAFLSLAIFLIYPHFHVSDKVSGLENEESIKKSLAILPFENRSNLKDDVFFTNGIHDELLTRVSKIHQLKIISRTSVLTYRDTLKNIRDISKELGVSTILEGGVQRAGDEIRINVQLIDAINDKHLWAETYTRKLSVKNIFTIQTEISESIAKQLEIVLSPKNEKFPTQSMEALKAFFRATAAIDKNTNKGYQEAINHLEQAIQLDPKFAIAYAELASRYLDQIYLEGLPSETQISKAKPLIDIALKLDENSSHAYRVLAKLSMYQKNFNAGKLAYEQAIKLNPNNAEAIGALGGYYMYEGDIQKAVTLLFKARELNPKDDKLADSLSLMLLKSGRFDEAKDILTDIIQRKPDYSIAYRTLSDLYYFGDHDIVNSIKTLYHSVILDPEFIATPLVLAMRYEDIGQTATSIKWLEFFLKIAPNSREAEITRADIYTLLKQYNKAFDIYLKEVKKHPYHLYSLLELGEKTGRINEAIARCRTISPELFFDDVVIDSRNMSTAFILGRNLKSQGKSEQANKLLQGSLKVARKEVYGGRQSIHYNWVARILLALGDKKAALKSFEQYVKLGFHSYAIINNPDYNSLHDNTEYQKLVSIMKSRLKLEQKKLKILESHGKLNLPDLPANTLSAN